MKKQLWIFSSVIIIIFLSGCALTPTQKEAASRFAQASADIGDFAAAEFNHFRAATIDMNVTSIAIHGKAKLLNDKNEPNLDEALKSESVIERVKSAQALSSYGRLLMSLVTETQEAELKQASNNFVNSFKSVSGKKLSDAQYEALGQLVHAIGSFWVEAKRAEAVRSIVKNTGLDIEKLCDLLIEDFNKTGLQNAQGFDATITNLSADADIALAKSASYTDRLIAINGFKQAFIERERLNHISKTAITTFIKLKAANAQLIQAIENNNLSIDDIKAVGQEMNNLRSAITALSNK
ncbi:hypothetical protein [Nitrosomonas ureae]|uniref:Lipoprotein n=1 Tax=Nitrosomonas ureae TaxID=44577 RepID=A0A1H9AAX0_9PROT|nr:hypothetical protein [Nitrosomonas ureae]PXX11388.1 hypothetical protein C8R27_1292 [Nitrosomonas ureae]SEP73637.1 hypothetical protein SAMN05421510_100330 [Nitrosomonas ureae]